MLTRALPLVYERLWRPLGGRLLMGVLGPDTADEHRLALEMLAPRRDAVVLDLACGPGNFTRTFARAVPHGLVVGVDASPAMLARAVRDTEARHVAYVRADASRLPFARNSFDAVCCFAALYLLERPMEALSEIARVLRPGGRVAVLTSCHRGPLPVGLTAPLVRGVTGLRIFGRGEITDALRARGFVDVEQRVTGLAQFVSGRRGGRRA